MDVKAVMDVRRWLPFMGKARTYTVLARKRVRLECVHQSAASSIERWGDPSRRPRAKAA